MNVFKPRCVGPGRFAAALLALACLLLVPAFGSPARAAEEGVDEELEFLLEDEEDAAEETAIADPIEPWNKAMYHFNDRLYFWLLKPVATGYKTVTPDLAREGVRNFFNNLATPIRFVGCLLQGKSERAGVELGRFMVNTTFGVLGFGNPASLEPTLQVPPEEDLGQAFGSWGIGNGFYIVWPILGPSTLRDSAGTFGQSFLSPLNYVDPEVAGIGARAFDQINDTSFRLGDYEKLKNAALDPYVAIRDGYIQRRNRQLEE
ncbi:MAG: VacJ family lipoprotein [Desulfococcaceae bacterium]